MKDQNGNGILWCGFKEEEKKKKNYLDLSECSTAVGVSQKQTEEKRLIIFEIIHSRENISRDLLEPVYCVSTQVSSWQCKPNQQVSTALRSL